MGDITNYTQKDFDRLIDDIWEASGKLLHSKGQEYASDGERLGNFKRMAALSGMRPSEVAYVFLLKHVDALGQAVHRGNVPFVMETTEDKEGLKQRLCDAINYHFLLAACLEDEARVRGG